MLPNEDAFHMVLRTQQFIAEEYGVADSVDPMGS